MSGEHNFILFYQYCTGASGEPRSLSNTAKPAQGICNQIQSLSCLEVWVLRVPLLYIIPARDARDAKQCVCVHPWAKGLPPLPLSPVFHKLSLAGACDTLLLSHATKLWRRVGRETWPVSCTCDTTVDHAVTPIFPCLIPWSLHDRPLNLFPPQACSRLATLQQYSSCRLFRHAVPSPSFPSW